MKVDVSLRNSLLGTFRLNNTMFAQLFVVLSFTVNMIFLMVFSLNVFTELSEKNLDRGII